VGWRTGGLVPESAGSVREARKGRAELGLPRCKGRGEKRKKVQNIS